MNDRGILGHEVVPFQDDLAWLTQHLGWVGLHVLRPQGQPEVVGLVQLFADLSGNDPPLGVGSLAFERRDDVS